MSDTLRQVIPKEIKADTTNKSDGILCVPLISAQ